MVFASLTKDDFCDKTNAWLLAPCMVILRKSSHHTRIVPLFQELKNAQKVWRKHHVPGFNFYIGFNGRNFDTGLSEERQGDWELISECGACA